MSGKRISRNDPCPCGSGRKFKQCCINKDVDWQARKPAGTAKLLPTAPRPREAAGSGLGFLSPYRVIDSRLREMAAATPGEASWKPLVNTLSDRMPEVDRMAVYQAVRQAGILPEDAALFLFGHATQWFTSEESDLDRHIDLLLRRYGLDEMADLHARDAREYDRRYELGRQFFHGPRARNWWPTCVRRGSSTEGRAWRAAPIASLIALRSSAVRRTVPVPATPGRC